MLKELESLCYRPRIFNNPRCLLLEGSRVDFLENNFVSRIFGHSSLVSGIVRVNLGAGIAVRWRYAGVSLAADVL